MRMRNPFRYGSRVTGGAFFDRERIIRDMLERMFASPSRPFYNSAQKIPLLAYHLASK